ncbi:hypothetical protein V3C99_000837, partial [Haemonchus contortus]
GVLNHKIHSTTSQYTRRLCQRSPGHICTNASMTYDFNNNRGQVCTNFLTLRSRGKEATEVTPSRKIRNFFYRIVTTIDVEDALLILLAKDCDQKDVDIAGRLLKFNMDKGIVKRFSTAVINMGDSSFDNWYDNEKTNMRVNAKGDIDDIADYVSRFICDTPITTTPPHHTTPASTPTSSSTQTSTTPRFLTSTSTPRRTTPTSASTSSSPLVPTDTPAPVVRTSSECECVPKSIWLDVFLLMEAGVFMGSNRIASATDYIVSAFAKMTVGQAEQFQSRLGVIRYASSVDLIADLDVYTSTEDLLDLDILPLNETETNIEGAIRMARERFESTSHRAAARKVIIIVGSTYREAVLNNPLKVAEQFRAEGGIIITIEYVQEQEKSVPMLRKLASPNYSLINYKDGKQLHAQELRQLLCEANCFCKKKWIPYNTDKWQAPQGGCYYPFLIPSMQILANRTCFRKNDGVLAIDEDSNKNAFLMSLFPPKTKFWLGLQLKGSQWLWQNGRPADKFTKWAKGHPKIGMGKCVYMEQYTGSKSAWFSDDCDNDHYHICQAKPCDSSKYCAVGFSNDELDI